MRRLSWLVCLAAFGALQAYLVNVPMRELSDNDYTWTLLVPLGAFLGLALVWAATWCNDRRRFGAETGLMRKVAVRFPRLIQQSGLKAPDRTVRQRDGSYRTTAGEPFRVRLAVKRFRNQELPGLLIRVPAGLRVIALSAEHVDEVAQSIGRNRWEFCIVEDRRGDRGRWRFFHLVAFRIEEEQMIADMQGTGVEEH